MQTWSTVLAVELQPPTTAGRHRFQARIAKKRQISQLSYRLELPRCIRPSSSRATLNMTAACPRWDAWDSTESIGLVTLTGPNEGAWFPPELSTSYLWFKVLLKNVFPIFMALQAWQGPPSNLLAMPLNTAGDRLVVWKKRGKLEDIPRRFCGSCANNIAVDKFAGYLPLASTSTSTWQPPKQQLLLPAPPVPWQHRTWSDIAAVRLQLLVALETISSELDWYFANFKSRMRAPHWWEDMDYNYGFSIVSLIGFGYWIQGFRCFPWLAMNYYMKDGLQLDPVALQCLMNTVNLPYLAKPLYGVVSDSVYICGSHRVPYIIIAGIFQVMSWGTIVAMPEARKSAGMLTAFLTFGNLGAAVADVANDALVAETGKKSGKEGQLQSFAWLASAAGGLLGNLLSGLALSSMDFSSMFSVFVLALGCHVSIACMVSEHSFGSKARAQCAGLTRAAVAKFEHKMPTRGNRKQMVRGKQAPLAEKQQKPPSVDIQKQFTVLFRLVESPRVLFPLLWFVGSYAVVPTLSGSIFYYQSQELQINPLFLGLSKMLGQGGLLVGSLLYERYLKPVPLRTLVGCVQVLLSLCMLSDIGLVYRINLQLGIPDQLYILGASAFVDAINQFKVLPFMVFFAKLCPAGCEGSLLAFFMSCQCLACLVGGYLGAALAAFLNISSSNFANLPLGIFIQAMAALLPVLGIMLLPGAEIEQETKVEKVA